MQIAETRFRLEFPHTTVIHKTGSFPNGDKFSLPHTGLEHSGKSLSTRLNKMLIR